MIKRFFSSLLGLLTIFAGWSQTPQLPDDPRQLTIYQVMVASFIHGEDGAPGYTRMWGPDGHTKDGNIRGIIQSLDHIQSLGCNALWMTPIFDCSQSQCEEKLKSTGYFTNNYFAIDPHFGTEAEVRELIDEAHRRGIAIIFDGVFGHHGGITVPSPQGLMPESEGAKSDRHNGGGANVAFPASLPYITEVATYWIEQFGIDGWRLDVAPQLLQGGHNYWIEVRRAVERLCTERRQRGETVGILASHETCAALADLIPENLRKDYGPRGDLPAIAARIYEALISLDDTPATALLAEGTTERGLGLAIMNRLHKASGFHSLHCRK